MHWIEEDIGRLDGLNIGNIAELQFIYEKAEAETPTASGKNQSGNASGASGLTVRRTEPRSTSLSANSGKQAAVLGESRDRVLEGAWKKEERAGGSPRQTAAIRRLPGRRFSTKENRSGSSLMMKDIWQRDGFSTKENGTT